MCDISHRSASHFKDIVGQVGCFWVFGVLFIFFLGVLLPKKKQRKNRRKDKPATWERRGDCHSAGVWWLSGSSPPLQMWRKHTLLFLFSPLCHPPPRPPLCSLFLSFPLLISSPCLACCFLTLHASAYSLGISLPLSPFIYLFTSLASHIPVLPLLFFPLSILSVEMSGWSEALCPGDCCAIRFSDGPDFVCMSVCTWRALTRQEKWTFPFIQA